VSAVLVVGAAGLIGRAVLDEARRFGEAVAVVGRPTDEVPGAHVLRLSSDAVEPLSRLLERLEPKAIVNCTGRTSGQRDELWRASVEPVAALVEAMQQAALEARLVHVGSAAEYAEIPAGSTDEDAPPGPSSPYAAAKLAASRLVSDAAESGLDTVIARVFNPIGPGMPATSLPGRAVRLLVGATRRRAAWIELGPLDTVRDYIDLRDIATAVVVLASAPSLAHRAYNVGSGRPTVVRELVGMLADRVGFSGEIRETAVASPRSAEIGHQVADIARMRATGWAPRVTLRESVDALVTSLVEPKGPR
jgi:nucleoside-diphosphate-sugar epimerase